MGVCGSAPPPQPHRAIAALLGRFLPRLGPLVATQAAFLFCLCRHVCSNSAPAQIFQSTTRPSCLLLPHRQAKGKPHGQDQLSGDLQRQGRRHPQARPHLQPNRSATRSSWRPMSQMGQKRKSGDTIATSALPLKADITRHYGMSVSSRYCCKSRKSTIRNWRHLSVPRSSRPLITSASRVRT